MLISLIRGLPRLLLLFALGLIFLIFSIPFSRALEIPELSPPLWYIGWSFIIAMIVDIVRRVMMPSIDFQKTAGIAVGGNVGAGLVLLATSIFLAAFVVAAAGLISQ